MSCTPKPSATTSESGCWITCFLCNDCAQRYEELSDAEEQLWKERPQASGLPDPPPVSAEEMEASLAMLWQKIDVYETQQAAQHRLSLRLCRMSTRSNCWLMPFARCHRKTWIVWPITMA